MITVLIGVAGAGKTTIGRALARATGARFLEGDELHPPENVAKMARGEPLDDRDRAPWLEAIAKEIDAAIARGEDLVVACSALKRAYRDVLRRPETRFVLLEVPADEAKKRVASRVGHFFPPELVQSQTETLEEADAGTSRVDATLPVERVVGEIAGR